MMPFSAALSTEDNTSEACVAACAMARRGLGAMPRLSIAFYSPHHAANAVDLATALADEFGPAPTLGILGESIVCGKREIEDVPAIGVWLAAWDDQVSIDPFHLVAEQTPDGASLLGWPDALLEAGTADALMVCLGDPYTFPVADLFLPRVNEDYPGLPVIGGMASSPMGAGTPSLILNGEVKDQGAVGVLLRGAKFRTVVSQGCRPVGRPLVVTKGQENIIAEVGGVTPLEYLRGLLDSVSPKEHELMQRGLLVGLAMSEYREQFRRGDFLIRNLIGLDPRTGALAVTDRIRRGQTIQFHVRDAATADEDLTELLGGAGSSDFTPSGALLFTCNGRGSRLFTTADHDARAIQTSVGPLPLAGMFAAGELGPVAGRNFIHGFTASTVLFA